MKNAFIVFGVLLMTCGFFACNDEDTGLTCGSYSLPDQFLRAESSTLIDAYENASMVVFKDSLGVEYAYEVAVLNSGLNNNVTPIDCGRDTQIVTFQGERNLIRLNGPDSTDLSISLAVDFLGGETRLEVDRLLDILYLSVFEATNFFEVLGGRMQIITSARQSNLDHDGLNAVIFEKQAQYNVLNETFADVYVQSSAPSLLNFKPIAFSTTMGIVSFYNRHDILLVLDRIE